MKYNIRFKTFWLLILLVTGLTTASFAQLSKMQFEDAELAFSEGKFADAIVLLDAAEKSNKGANPPIIHLRILCRVELIKMNPERNFDIIDKARKETDFFLKEYERDASLEEKYREVYKASKVLKDLPLTQAEFDEAIRVKKEAVAKAERTRKEKMQTFLSYSLFKDFERGYTIEDFKKRNKLKDKHFITARQGYKIFNSAENGKYNLFFLEGKAIGCQIWKGIADNAAYDKGKQLVARNIAYYTDLFGFKPEEEETRFYTSAAEGKAYVWRLQHKTFIVESYFLIDKGKYTSEIYYYDLDKSCIRM